jgi:hypothetical protein
MEVPMKSFAIASLLLVGLSVPAFADMANQAAGDTSPNYHFNAKDNWPVIDTVKNCAVLDTKPSSYDVSGLKILGKKSGYSSPSAAENEIKSDSSMCKGMVGNA